MSAYNPQCSDLHFYRTVSRRFSTLAKAVIRETITTDTKSINTNKQWREIHYSNTKTETETELHMQRQRKRQTQTETKMQSQRQARLAIKTVRMHSFRVSLDQQNKQRRQQQRERRIDTAHAGWPFITDHASTTWLRTMRSSPSLSIRKHLYPAKT